METVYSIFSLYAKNGIELLHSGVIISVTVFIHIKAGHMQALKYTLGSAAE